jgi:streptogramin lyase
VARFEDLDNAEALAATPGGGVWVADLAGDRLLRLDADGRVVAESPGRPGVVALTPDPVVPGGVWAADRGRRRVVLLDGSGVDAIVLGGLPAPSSVAVSPDGSEVWVADPALGELIRFSRSGEVLVRNGLIGTPLGLAVAFDPLP